MLAHDQIPGILPLPSIHEYGLGEAGSDDKEIGETGRLDSGLGERLVHQVRSGHRVANLVSTKVHVQAAEPDAGLVDHVGGKVPGPAHQHGLAESSHIDGISQNGLATIKVKVVSTVEQIPGGNIIIAQLEVILGKPVKTMEWGRKVAVKS